MNEDRGPRTGDGSGSGLRSPVFGLRPPSLARARDVASTLLPWGVIAVMGVSVMGVTVSESIQRLVQQNGAVLLLVALLMQYAPRAIEVQRQQAVAMAELAAAVRELPRREDLKFEQVLIGLEYISDQVKRLPCIGPPGACPTKEATHVG